MHRPLVVFALVLAVVAVAGCSRDSEVTAVDSEINAFTTELVSKVETASDPSSGIDDAQKLLDSKQADLSAKAASMMRIRDYQVKHETMEKYVEDMFDNIKKMDGLKEKYASRAASDAAFKAKLDKLVDDYGAILHM